MTTVQEIWKRNLSKLIERAREGDTGALKALRDHYGPELQKQAAQMFSDPAEAQKAVDNTFAKAFANLQYLKDESTIEQWLTNILSNEAALSSAAKNTVTPQAVKTEKPKKRSFTALLAVLLVAAIAVGGMAVYSGRGGKTPGGSSTGGSAQPVEVLKHPALFTEDIFGGSAEITANTPAYSSDLGTVINPGVYPPEVTWYNDPLGDEGRTKLQENYFVTRPADWGYEFYDIYFSNPGGYVPTFITTDSLLHAFHQYYAFLQKNTERDYLYDRLKEMSEKLYANSLAQKQELTGTPWEAAAERNIGYYGIAVELLGGEASLSADAQAELSMILDGSGVSDSLLFANENSYTQDYSQFKPRGYYTESDRLEAYFRAMMWYGQMNFARASEDLTRSAVLSVLAMDEEAYQLWSEIYSVTAFFAGESDDLGYSEYYPAVVSVYGENVTVNDLAADEDRFTKLREVVGQFASPGINSVYRETGDEDTAGFRVLGQRFTFDGYAIERLTNGVTEADKKPRSLPTGLDIPAALGSDLALQIAEETTDIQSFPSYASELEKLRTAADEKAYPCVSSAWLSMIRTQLKADGEGMPSFMQSKAWETKKLNTFMGSYTELKHDTVLYNKEPWGGLGDAGMELNVDDRGYVEPEAELYRRCAVLAKTTAETLSRLGMISDKDRERMETLSETARRLQTMSEKELRAELLTDEEFAYIRSGYAGFLYDIWYATEIEPDPGTSTLSEDHPSALITDIAVSMETGDCLELAEGYPMEIYVLVNVEGKIRIARGAVYSYYEFTYPADSRLTDDEWRDMLKNGTYTAADTAEWTRVSYTDPDKKPVITGEVTAIIGSVTIKVTNLNSRSIPSTSGEKLAKVKDGQTYTVYDIAYGEGYTWYRIGEDRWIADQDGKWVDFYPEG